MKDSKLDEKIRETLGSLQRDIPNELNRRIHEKIGNNRHSPTTLAGRILRLIKWSPAAAAAVFLLLLGLSEMNRPISEERPIREVRIQYELKEKNIKILWVKKENFHLHRRKK